MAAHEDGLRLPPDQANLHWSLLDKPARRWHLRALLEQQMRAPSQAQEAPTGPGADDGTAIAPIHARVLLVEDNFVNQQVALGLLEEMGVVPDVADNGRIAVDRVLANPYDVVLMDMHMPVLDGIEATREIRKHPHLRSLPIIALTANVMSEDRVVMREAGMDDFLSKPIDPQALYVALLHWSHASRRADSPQDSTAP
jgi:CheY-like chemotaxis protein